MNENVPVNPYAPPRAEVSPPVSQTRVFSAFPRFSTWGVFGLAIITLSMYLYYWLYNRTQILNRLLRDRPESQISPALMWTTVILVVVNLLLSIVVQIAVTTADPEQMGAFLALSAVSTLVSLVATVLFLIWIFKFRNRINSLSGATKGSPYWAGAILTFFLNVLYMSYKINQLIDRENQVG